MSNHERFTAAYWYVVGYNDQRTECIGFPYMDPQAFAELYASMANEFHAGRTSFLPSIPAVFGHQLAQAVDAERAAAREQVTQ